MTGKEWLWQWAQTQFWKHVEKTDLGCWVWKGKTDRDGYGILPRIGRLKAHQFSFLLHTGPLIEGLLICHTCDTPGCVRPDHLYIGTPKENVEDMVRRGRHRNQYRNATHCIHGHEFTPENTLRFGPQFARTCRVCHNARGAKNRRARGVPQRIAKA